MKKDLAAGIDERCRQLIAAKFPGQDGPYKGLESETGVSSTSWRNFLTGGLKPSAAAVAGLSRAWPQHAFWLVTGIEDRACGHVAPPSAEGDIDGEALSALITVAAHTRPGDRIVPPPHVLKLMARRRVLFDARWSEQIGASAEASTA